MPGVNAQLRKDWADWRNNRQQYLWAWGFPTALLIIGVFLPAPVRTAIWTLALIWKGSACLANAARCGRTHCHITGPFYLAMALATVLHGTQMLSLGAFGWWWIGLGIVLGKVVLWILPERVFGQFLRD